MNKGSRGKELSRTEIVFLEKRFEFWYIVASFVLLAVLLVLSNYFCNLHSLLKSITNYFIESRIDLLCGLYSTLIGIYLAIVTIIATSFLGITKKLLEQRQDKSLIYLMIWGILECVSAISICIFLPTNFPIYGICVVLVFVLVLVSLLRFVALLTKIFLFNMDAMGQEIDKKSSDENDSKDFRDKLLDYIGKDSTKYGR